MIKYTKQSDQQLADILNNELNRQMNNIEMIASESTVPIEIMELSGSIFINKTLEGYPGKRFQQGAQFADELEELAIQRGKELFNCDHINIQPYSGATANYSVYAAMLEPGDKILSLSLDQGGHLTHGSKANFMTKVFDFQHYSLDPETELIDYNDLENKAREFKPKMIIAGGSAYPRTIDFERISKVAKEVEAYFMVDMAHYSGLIAAGVYPSPTPYADFLTSSTSKTIGGPRSGFIISKAEHAKNIDKGVFPNFLGSMHLTTMAAKCWLFDYAKSDKFKQTMKQVVKNARTLADEIQKHGFRVVSGGTDSHIVLVDVRNKNITGREFDEALNQVGITVNKNQIPFDPLGPNETSGVRIGLTSITQRGMKEDEVVHIAEVMSRVADNIHNKDELEKIKQENKVFIKKFPLFTDEELNYLTYK